MKRTLGTLVILLALAAGVWSVGNLSALAQGHSNDPNVVMLDDCSVTDPAYDALGGCPEGSKVRGKSFKGDVPLAEFFALLFSPLAPGGQVIGHPSWRNEPSYISVRSGQAVRVVNRGGRAHTFTKVADFGGGFVGPLNGALQPAPECGAEARPNPQVVFVGVNESQRLTELSPGLHKFQCCIHPWMRAAIRVE